MTNNSSNTTELDDRSHSELLAMYNAAVSSIAFFKSQQWKITNYAVLIYAAVIGTAKIVLEARNFSTISFGVLFLLALLTLLFGWYILEKLETSLKDERSRLKKIGEMLNIIKKKFPEDLLPVSEHSTLIIFFRSILITGFLIDVWILLLGNVTFNKTLHLSAKSGIGQVWVLISISGCYLPIITFTRLFASSINQTL